jgi:hypothetical protein
MFIVLYVFLEHQLSRGDYRRPDFVHGRRARMSRQPAHPNGSSQRQPVLVDRH